ncbi:hypothetical protein [Cupriavidus pauculus]|uniref:ATP-dependent DNA ligase n=1 Tax=Cupriavidus pauculus TaxID=82633 RepID=UPI003857F305
MLAVRRLTLPAKGDWSYEIKFDGYRILASNAPPALKTRGGAAATSWFPELVAAVGQLPAGTHILDGEACVLNDIGLADFDRMHARALRRRWYEGADPVTLCAFDLVVHDGIDIRGLPLEERKARLRTLVSGVPGILFVDGEPDGMWLYSAMRQLKGEGVVAKRVGSPYVAGESNDWVKVKLPARPGFRRG